jgi:hypothetical protein
MLAAISKGSPPEHWQASGTGRSETYPTRAICARMRAGRAFSTKNKDLRRMYASQRKSPIYGSAVAATSYEIRAAPVLCAARKKARISLPLARNCKNSSDLDFPACHWWLAHQCRSGEDVARITTLSAAPLVGEPLVAPVRQWHPFAVESDDAERGGSARPTPRWLANRLAPCYADPQFAGLTQASVREGRTSARGGANLCTQDSPILSASSNNPARFKVSTRIIPCFKKRPCLHF